MDEWKDSWMDECLHGILEACMELKNRLIDGLDKWSDCQTDKWSD